MLTSTAHRLLQLQSHVFQLLDTAPPTPPAPAWGRAFASDPSTPPGPPGMPQPPPGSSSDGSSAVSSVSSDDSSNGNLYTVVLPAALGSAIFVLVALALLRTLGRRWYRQRMARQFHGFKLGSATLLPGMVHTSPRRCSSSSAADEEQPTTYMRNYQHSHPPFTLQSETTPSEQPELTVEQQADAAIASHAAATASAPTLPHQHVQIVVQPVH